MVKSKTWKQRLTKKQRNHLLENGIRTKIQMQEQVIFLKGEVLKRDPLASFPCWECREIAIRLGLWGELNE